MQPINLNNAQGIDVSHWQYITSWSKVKAAGKDFVYVKSTEGSTYKDPNFEANIAGANNAGLLTGIYHFLDASTASEGEAEAANFLRAIDGKHVDLPYTLDVEKDGNTAEAALAFLAKAESALGYKMMMYSYGDFANRILQSKFTSRKFWLANYSGGVQSGSVAGWTQYEFLQYSEKGTVDGISGYCDLNIYRASLDTLKAYYGITVTLDADVANTVIATWLQPSYTKASDQQQKNYIHWLADQLRYAARILTPPAGFVFTAEVANTIINTWIGPDYAATASDDQKAYDHWLANQLRTASGQPTT